MEFHLLLNFWNLQIWRFKEQLQEPSEPLHSKTTRTKIRSVPVSSKWTLCSHSLSPKKSRGEKLLILFSPHFCADSRLQCASYLDSHASLWRSCNSLRGGVSLSLSWVNNSLWTSFTCALFFTHAYQAIDVVLGWRHWKFSSFISKHKEGSPTCRSFTACHWVAEVQISTE